MNEFSWHNPCRLEFGRSRRDGFMATIAGLADRVLLLYGGGSIKANGVYDLVTKALAAHRITAVELSGVEPNPKIASVREGVRLCREHDLKLVLAVGGGSVIDCAKGIAAGVPYKGDPWDFYIGKARIKDPLPVAAWLTLAATGSEMNGGSVVSNPETRDKRPAMDHSLIPVTSLLDPDATMTLPARQTAAGTADIMSHVFEQYFSSVADTTLQDRMSEAVLKTCVDWAPTALLVPDDREARNQLLWAGTIALNGLLSCGKGGDWATHSIEHAVSALTDMTHGVGLAILTPHWMEHILDAASAVRMAALAREVWGIDEDDELAAARKGIAALREFFTEMGLPSRLRDEGVAEKDLPEMARLATADGAQGGYRPLDQVAVFSILKAAW